MATNKMEPSKSWVSKMADMAQVAWRNIGNNVRQGLQTPITPDADRRLWQNMVSNSEVMTAPHNAPTAWDKFNHGVDTAALWGGAIGSVLADEVTGRVGGAIRSVPTAFEQRVEQPLLDRVGSARDALQAQQDQLKTLGFDNPDAQMRDGESYEQWQQRQQAGARAMRDEMEKVLPGSSTPVTYEVVPLWKLGKDRQ